MAAKQVIHFTPRKDMTMAESNEYQRRWSNKAWDERLKRGNYDRSRDRLNFEIGRGGVVQEIDKKISIQVRMKQNLALRGIKYRNEGQTPPKYRTLCSIIFSGSRDRMREIAFGDQPVDWRRDADNSNINRLPTIEEWAKDCYDFACKEWGEDNIVGFYVHLDEMTPHAHCVVIPYDAKRNKVSFKNVFAGRNTYEFRERTLALHDRYYSMIGSKWGLERGETKNDPLKNKDRLDPEAYLQKTKAEAHEAIQTKEAAEQEKQEIEIQLEKSKASLFQTRKSVKGLTTMIDNLDAEQKRLENSVSTLRAELKKTRKEDDTLSFSMIRRREELEEYERALEKLEATLVDKREKLAQASEDLEQMEDKLIEQEDKLKVENEKTEQLQAATRILGTELVGKNTDAIKHFVKAAVCDVVMSSFAKTYNQLDEPTKQKFTDTPIQQIFESGTKVVSVASMLFFGMVGAALEATQAANASGGGGSDNSDLPWSERRDGEDDNNFIKRCVSHAAKLCTRGGRRGGLRK